MQMFENEEQMKELLMKWLSSNGFVTRRGLRLETFEIDIVALAAAKITEEGVKKAKDRYVYAFETKIATTYKLAKEVVEQAIVRLLVADYVYVVVPKMAEVWKDDKTKDRVSPPDIVRRIASGTYSKNIGIIAMDLSGSITVVRSARKSGLTIKELRTFVLREAGREERIKLLR